MPTVIVNQQLLHYRMQVGGLQPADPPLVLVHGAGGNLMHWPGELRRLPGRTVYGVDLPGHGKSGGAGRSEIGAYTEDLHAWTAALHLSAFVLAGHSMGGAIAQEFALRYPARLAGLILVGTGARLRVAPQVLEGVLQDYTATARLIAERTHGPGADPNLLRLYVRRLQEVSPAVLHGDFIACDQFDRRADVARIDCPTLIICGDADVMTPVKYSRYLQEQIARSELLVLPGAGHMVMLERPVEVVAACAAFQQRLAP